MKQGTLTSRIVMLVLLSAVVLYLGVYAWDFFSNPFSTFLSYPYTVDTGAEATGFLVREEQVIPGAGALVDLTRSEGERVARGAEVAVAYQSEAAAQRRAQIHALELEREQLTYSLGQNDATGDSAQLSHQVLDAIVGLKAAVAEGDLTRLEEKTLALKSLVYKRDAAYGEAGGDAAAIQARVDALDEQIRALTGQASQDTSRVTVDEPGVFSALVDGYEGLFTPDMLWDFTPRDLDALARRRVEADERAVGKLITSNIWYFACAVDASTAAQIWEGQTVTVRFSLDWSGEVPMTVERVGEPESDRCAVVFSSDRYLSEITLLRRQTVELVFSSQAGIRVPSQAIRVVTQLQEDPDTGEEVSSQVTGVYALVGAQAEFKPVTVIRQRDDYCIVVPVPGESERSARKALRPGDEIIVAAAELYDGKVVR